MDLTASGENVHPPPAPPPASPVAEVAFPEAPLCSFARTPSPAPDPRQFTLAVQIAFDGD